MTQRITDICIAAVLSITAAESVAGVVQSFGSGSAVRSAQFVANFELNTTLANDYSEGNLLFSLNGTGSNAGCGYAGVNCVAPGDVYSLAFSGNYFATDGLNAYIDIKVLSGALSGIEFAVDSGYATVFGYWQTYSRSVLTGAGNFNAGAGGTGAVLGLRDGAGFDEVRYYAFSADNKTSGFSAPAIDTVRAAKLPAPGSFALVAVALVACLRTSRGRRPEARVRGLPAQRFVEQQGDAT